MKHNFSYVRLFVSLLFILLIVQFVVLAQDAEPTSITLNDAITIVETDFAGDAIHELSLDTEKGCWSFELASGAEVCISVTDGTVVEDDDSIPTNVSGTSSDDEASDDADDSETSDDADDDISDDADDSETSDDADDDVSDDVDDNEASDDDTSDLVIGITLEEAIAAALRVYPNATIVSIELEEGYNGQGVWDIELDTGQEVDIALDDGQILGFGYTDDDEVEPAGRATTTDSTVGTTSSDDASDDIDDASDDDDSEDDDSDDDSEDDDSSDDD